MFYSRLFGFVAVTLCLLAFVCAHGAGSDQTVRNKVREAKGLTHKVLMNVQDKYINAEDIKDGVESRTASAQSAANDAETAAKGNAEAVTFAQKARTAVTEYLQLYPNAKDDAQKAFDFANDLFRKARQLYNNAQKLTVPDRATEEQYTQLSASAANFTNEANEIEQKINAARTLIGIAESKLWKLTDYTKEAQVAKYQVDAIVKVSEIENMLNQANADIKVIEQKENEVNATVEAIKELFTNISDEVLQSISRFLNNANRDLIRITNSVEKAKEAHEEMLKQQKNAEEALKEINKKTDESQARRKLKSINTYAKNAAASLTSISEELQSAVAHVEYANNRKTKAEIEIAKNSKPNSADVKTTETPQPPAKEEGANKHTNTGTEQTLENNQGQPVKTNPIQRENKGTEQTVEEKKEQSVNNAPIKPTDKETDGPAEKRLKKSVNNEPTQPSKQGTKQTVQNEPKQSVKDKIQRFVSNEGLSTSDVINDNAITTTFLLPLALIVFSALHGGY